MVPNHFPQHPLLLSMEDNISGESFGHFGQLFSFLGPLPCYVCMHISCFCHVQPFETLWTIACQASLSIEFSVPDYWSGLPCPPPEDLPDPGFKPTSHILCIGRAFFTTHTTWEALSHVYMVLNFVDFLLFIWPMSF